MNHYYLAALLVLAAGVTSCTKTEQSETASEYVDMLIGTARKGHTIVSSGCCGLTGMRWEQAND